MRKPDEIMAEYLLKGGKMLAKTCTDCGSPLFEYKGETFCAVCREAAVEEQERVRSEEQAKIPEKNSEPARSDQITKQITDRSVRDQFSHTIKTLLIQIEESSDSRSLKEISDAVKVLSESYALFSHE